MGLCLLVIGVNGKQAINELSWSRKIRKSYRISQETREGLVMGFAGFLSALALILMWRH